MAKQNDSGNDTVKKNTMLLASFICLAVGFLGGVVFSAYKSGSGVPVPASMPQQPQQKADQEETISEDQAKRILALEKEVAATPNNADAWTQLGNLYFDTNNFESAIRSYKKSLALKPNEANVQTDLGVMYRRAGQPKEAIEAFEKAARIDPKHEIARFNKGIVLLHDLNDREGALKTWEQLVDINPAAMTPGGKPLAEMIKALRESPKP
ncbi:MAG TPA: tetratricopeptide repeat protein [Deltaproteobacteria bacterium]|nr:tetratricopeptide repeat protein [Deltaproteobacteria bacterium]